MRPNSVLSSEASVCARPLQQDPGSRGLRRYRVSSRGRYRRCVLRHQARMLSAPGVSSRENGAIRSQKEELWESALRTIAYISHRRETLDGVITYQPRPERCLRAPRTTYRRSEYYDKPATATRASHVGRAVGERLAWHNLSIARLAANEPKRAGLSHATTYVW